MQAESSNEQKLFLLKIGLVVPALLGGMRIKEKNLGLLNDSVGKK